MYEKRSAANMLRAVGMHPKYKGYAYVLCILEKTGMEPERLYGSAGEMYRLVEEKFGIKRAAMERCIRFAIQRTWIRATTSSKSCLARTMYAACPQ